MHPDYRYASLHFNDSGVHHGGLPSPVPSLVPGLHTPGNHHLAYENVPLSRFPEARDDGLLARVGRCAVDVRRLLRSLEVDVGQLHPAFSPQRRLYVLLVPDETTEVRFFATARHGEVMIDRRAGHLPVQLLPPGFNHKVVVAVAPEGEGGGNAYGQDLVHTDEQKHEYVIDVRRSGEDYAEPMDPQPPVQTVIDVYVSDALKAHPLLPSPPTPLPLLPFPLPPLPPS